MPCRFTGAFARTTPRRSLPRRSALRRSAPEKSTRPATCICTPRRFSDWNDVPSTGPSLASQTRQGPPTVCGCRLRKVVASKTPGGLPVARLADEKSAPTSEVRSSTRKVPTTEPANDAPSSTKLLKSALRKSSLSSRAPRNSTSPVAPAAWRSHCVVTPEVPLRSMPSSTAPRASRLLSTMPPANDTPASRADRRSAPANCAPFSCTPAKLAGSARDSSDTTWACSHSAASVTLARASTVPSLICAPCNASVAPVRSSPRRSAPTNDSPVRLMSLRVAKARPPASRPALRNSAGLKFCAPSKLAPASELPANMPAANVAPSKRAPSSTRLLRSPLPKRQPPKCTPASTAASCSTAAG